MQLPWERGGKGGKDWEFGTGRCKLVYAERIHNKDLPYSPGNSIQCSVRNHDGEYEKEYTYTAKSLRYTAEINTTL